ncbi:MAG: T9SS C-terminal target domain-containing protein [Calditrichaeota bacterium]|nr:MAG: T9SS C-terminal target domain-containing protein [Calditrichota bacterium]
MQGNQGAGIAISNACDNLIGGNRPSARNVISGNGYDGIDISHTGSKGNRIVGNYIGTDATGTRYLPDGVPKGGTGVRINDSAENTVGGLAQGEGNLIMGIAMTNPGVIGNHILGNYINTDITGSKAIMTGFGCGIVILQCSGNIIGPDNVISGCTDAAIYLGSSDPSVPTANTVIGNFIGTDPSGSIPVPNSIGVLIEGNSSNIIGGTAADEGNIIAFSQINSSGYGGSGVVIKTDWNDLVPVDNVVVGNQIFGNERLGIDLGDNNVPEMNDEGDFDEGPNRMMNLPVIESVIATPSRLIIRGNIDTQNPELTTIHFYGNSSPDEHAGYGEGEIYLGLVTPNKHGFFTAILRPIGAQNDFHYVSATGTDVAGNTSEFSLCAEISESQGKSTAKSAHPFEFGLGQNFPNPFNPITAIEFHLPFVTHVSMTIYDALGKEIIKLADGEMTAGDHMVRWNGTDSRGQQVANGLYFCQLVTADYTNIRKMSLCR